jgi:hypothetical protein
MSPLYCLDKQIDTLRKLCKKIYSYFLWMFHLFLP